MKKVYMKPQTEVFQMEAESLICDSPGLGGGSAQKGGGSLIKEDIEFSEAVDDLMFF